MAQKVAYVTGGMGGIGTAICHRMHKAGFKVIAGCGPTRDYAKWLDEQKAQGYTFYASVGNVADWDSTVQAFTKAISEHGTIDVLVNNAGITIDARLQKMDDDQFDRVIDVNLKGTFNCARAVVDTMVAQGRGAILNASSVVGIYGNFGQTNYAASKFGVIGFVKTWARELGPKGVRCNAVAPGFIETPILQTIPEKVLHQMKERVPLKRLGTAEDIANVYAFLASDDAAYINGAVIEVSGGLTV
jgi:NAD(P)-dependent dehydrogenase (short-subunit alcohol dehydrogenase family)